MLRRSESHQFETTPQASGCRETADRGEVVHIKGRLGRLQRRVKWCTYKDPEHKDVDGLAEVCKGVGNGVGVVGILGRPFGALVEQEHGQRLHELPKRLLRHGLRHDALPE